MVQQDAGSQPTLLAIAEALRRADPAYPEGRFAGKGIVVAAGGISVFTNAYVLVSVLRRTLGCTLPIEVWHYGAGELSPSMIAALRRLDVHVVDGEPVAGALGRTIRDGWQLKPFIMQQCRFAEVLLLDADQVPVNDPAAVFEWPEYRTAGAVFWPDIVDLREDNPVWDALGLPRRKTVSWESGQVLVDKRRHWRALAAVVRLNEEAERLYRLIYGDKDTFLVGWELAGADFALVPHRPYIDDRCLTQRDFSGNPLFQHRTNAKWTYAGEQHRLEGFVHEAACLDALDELRERWNGRLFVPPERSQGALEAERTLTGQRLFLSIGDEEVVALHFLPVNELGEGRAHDRPNWWCETDGGALRLLLGDPRRPTYRLTLVEEGHWEGERLRPPKAWAVLDRDRPLPGPARTLKPTDRDMNMIKLGYHRAEDDLG